MTHADVLTLCVIETNGNVSIFFTWGEGMFFQDIYIKKRRFVYHLMSS